MTGFAHLEPKVWNLVAAPPDERIKFIKTDAWVGYSAATSILATLDELASHPRNTRMPCYMLIGAPQNGKSSLLERCVKLHQPVRDPSDNIIVPVLKFETPPEPDEGRLYSEILKSCLVSHREDAAPERLKAQVIDRLIALGVRVVLADEFHGMLNGSLKNQRQFLASLKSLLNALRLPFVAAGTVDVTRALATDTQFVTRFEVLPLPRWAINMEFRKLLASIERILPLAMPSVLAGQDIARAIGGACGGTIGGIREIASRSAIAAIEAQEEQISLGIVQKVIDERTSRQLTNAIL